MTPQGNIFQFNCDTLSLCCGGWGKYAFLFSNMSPGKVSWALLHKVRIQKTVIAFSKGIDLDTDGFFPFPKAGID